MFYLLNNSQCLFHLKCNSKKIIVLFNCKFALIVSHVKLLTPQKTLGDFSFRDKIVSMPIRLNLKAGNTLKLAFPNRLFELTTKSAPFSIRLIIPDTHREKLFEFMKLIFGEISHKAVY